MTDASIKLSGTMKKALEFAREHDGKLTRFPGGFWGHSSSATFGTPTVEGLVNRGLGTYTSWRDGRHGRFPVEMTVVVRK